MKRNEQHEIDTVARRLFQSVLPSYLVVREQGDDYGIDAEVELFEQGESTGVIFKVQIKGTKNPAYSADGKFISFSFELNRAEYLIEQVKIPTAIVLCDVTAKIVFWTDIHTNQNLLQAYEAAKANRKNTFTIHFATENVLPNTLSEMLTALRKTGDIISLRRVANIQSPVYAEHIQNIKDVDAEIIHLREKIDISSAEKLYRLIRVHSTVEAHKLIQQILESNEASIQAKFNAMIHNEQVYVQSVGADEIGGFEKVAFDLWQAKQLLALTDETTPGLRRLAEGYLLAAEISNLVLQDYNLFMNWKMQQTAQETYGEPLEPLWFAMLPLVRTKYARELLDKIDESSKLISTTLNEKHWQVLPRITTRILGQIIFFLRRLKLENLDETAQGIENWIEHLLDLTYKITVQLPDSREVDEMLCGITHIYTFLMNPYDAKDRKKRYEQAVRVQQEIRDKEIREWCLANIEQTMSEFETIPNWDENNPDWEAIERFYRHQAAALGINLELAEKATDSLDARIAWIVNVGIKDLNPTRILKNCKHLVFEYSGDLGNTSDSFQLT